MFALLYKDSPMPQLLGPLVPLLLFVTMTTIAGYSLERVVRKTGIALTFLVQ